MKPTNNLRWIIIFFMMVSIVIGIVIIYLLLDNKDKISEEIRNTVTKQVNGINLKSPSNGKDGITPIKNVDYFDGKDGKNSQSTKIILKERETVIRERVAQPKNGRDGKDAPITLIRCNVERNRWEYKLYGDETWGVLNDEEVPCTVKDEVR